MHRHQVHRVDRVDDGVRLVAGRQAVEVRGEPGQREVAAVLEAPHEAADLLDVLARPRRRLPRSSNA